MSLCDKFTYRLSDKKIFKTDVSLKPFEHIDGNIVDYIHIRTKVVDDNGIEIPTKKGVTLMPCELEELLPHMIMGKQSYEINGDRRRIWFAQNKDKPYLFNLKTLKLDGKENSIDLTMVEIRKINFVKDKLIVNPI